jgi:endonuclease/exonuclease/phosphatase (EEP) superfamily protein YafD
MAGTARGARVRRPPPPVAPVALLPVDHVLARGFELVSGERGPDLGSDHYPVLARLARR